MTINPIIVLAEGGVPVDDLAALIGRTITTLVLPADMTGSIGNSAFSGCSRLTTLVLPAGMTGSIGASAFVGCSSLTELVLPAGLTGSIGNSAFAGCSSLTELVLPGPTLVSLSSTDAFSSTTCSIHVPAALVDSYRAAANWSALAGRIYAIVE